MAKGLLKRFPNLLCARLDMRFLSVASLVGCLLVASADAAEPETSAAGPTQALVRINASGTLEVMTRRLMYISEEKQRTVTVKEIRREPRTQTVKVTRDGKTVDETAVVNVDVVVEVPKTERYHAAPVLREDHFTENYPASHNGFVRTSDQTELAIYDLSGERFSTTVVEERLSDWTLVLISKTGKPLDRRVADLFQPTTIVVGIPPQKPPMPFDAGPSSKPGASTPKRQGPAASKPAAEIKNEPRPQLPESPQPTFAFVRVQGEKTIALRTEAEATHYLPRMTPRQNDGESKGDIRPLEWVPRVVETRETLAFPTSELSAMTVPKKVVTAAELESMLATETLAAMSVDGKPVDPFWLRNLREGALVVVAPLDPMWRLPPLYGPHPQFVSGLPGTTVPVMAPSK